MEFVNAKSWDIFKSWPTHWPPKEHYVSQHAVTHVQLDALAALIDQSASETQIEGFLRDNREVLALTLFIFGTGHHATWIYQKQHIRPNSGAPGGLIPDYVLAGADSDGVAWWILELKGADERAFIRRRKRVSLSRTASDGVCQLITYIDSAARSQAFLRDELQLVGFREPRGVLLIGSGLETEDSQIREFKASWNRLNPRVQIRSYGALVRTVRAKLQR